MANLRCPLNSTPQILSSILRTLAAPQTLAALLILADGPRTWSELPGSPAIARRLARAGLITMDRRGGARAAILCRLSPIVTVEEDSLTINAAGYPITLGRALESAESAKSAEGMI